MAHGFSRGGHESANCSSPPHLKRWATQSTAIHQISVDGALVRRIPSSVSDKLCPDLPILEYGNFYDFGAGITVTARGL